MYADHQPLIVALAQSSPAGLTKVATFAICSPRIPLWRLPDIVARAEQGDFTNLFSWKANGINAWRANAAERYDTLMRLRAFPAIQLSYCARQLGLGWPKAGFLLQLAFGAAGCLDSVNLDKYHIPERVVRRGARGKAKRQSTMDKAAKAYLWLCAKLGGTETLWDQWCLQVYRNSVDVGKVGRQSRNAYESPDHVSAYHCLAVGLDAKWRNVLDDIPF